MSSKVLFEIRDRIALLTLNDPDRRNALSREIVRGLFQGLDTAIEAGARAIVLAAHGQAFCAGANIDDLRNGWMEGKDPTEDPALLFKRFTESERPVIAAIHGPALGGGLELALSCDLAIAGDTAWFAMPELGHGVIPNTAAALLPRIVGMRTALDLILTRRRVAAPEALAIGLVNRVVPPEQALQEALALAHDIVAKVPPGALRAAKSNVQAHASVDWQRVLVSPLDVPSAEWQEGLDSFCEHRAPSFEPFWAKDAFNKAAGNPPRPL
jgi:enoyl-CoA hydratase/carnithine racemase